MVGKTLIAFYPTLLLGKSEPAAMLEVLVTLLECFTRIFELRISGLFVAADQYALLLK